MKVFTYDKCDTCRKALKFLKESAVSYENVPIREMPPTVDELRRMLGFVGDIKRLFNTSGRDYKEMKMAERLPTLSEAHALGLLAGNGNLIKRPFLLAKNGGTTGFKQAEWEAVIANK